MGVKRVSRIVTTAVLFALATASAQAGPGTNHVPTPSEKKSPSKEEGMGMATGAITGAIVAGPFGAAVGFIIGAVTGSGVKKVRDTKKLAASLETQLASTQQQLLDAQVALAASSEKSGDPMLAQLAQRLRADVMFRTASAELDSASAAKLADLGALLASYPGLAIEIDGYADPRGKAGENLELSQQRASAVRAALMVGGAAADNIRIVAHGEQLSTAPKGDLEAYAWERRVSFSVVSAGDKPHTEAQVAQTQ